MHQSNDRVKPAALSAEALQELHQLLTAIRREASNQGLHGIDSLAERAQALLAPKTAEPLELAGAAAA